MKLRAGILAALAVVALALGQSGGVRAQQACFGSSCAVPEPSPATGTGNWVRATSPTITTPTLVNATFSGRVIGGISAQNFIADQVNLNGIYGSAGSINTLTAYLVTTDAVKNSTYVLDSFANSGGYYGGSANASNGFGVGLTYRSRTTVNARDMVRISGVWTDATDATRSAAITFDTVDQAGALTERARIHAAGGLQLVGIVFASLGAPADGTLIYCPDCTIANPCAGAGTGAFAKRLNGAWVCN